MINLFAITNPSLEKKEVMDRKSKLHAQDFTVHPQRKQKACYISGDTIALVVDIISSHTRLEVIRFPVALGVLDKVYRVLV